MKKIVFLFIAFFMAMTLKAADQATTILDKAAAKVTVSKGTTMNFSISGDKIKQSGTIAVKGNKFCARTSNAIIWYDGKTQWLYNKKNDEVNISGPKNQNMNPYAFLNLYKNGYSKTVENSASGYEVHLIGKGKPISEMYILIDKGYNLKQVKMLQKGQWMTINVSGIKTTSLSDKDFVFNSKDYPKAEVIDLR